MQTPPSDAYIKIISSSMKSIVREATLLFMLTQHKRTVPTSSERLLADAAMATRAIALHSDRSK